MTANPAAVYGPSARTPKLTIVLYANGQASVGGVPVAAPDPHDLAGVRAAAMRTAIGMAVDRGQSLQALAFEPDGSIWPLVIHPDGRVEEDAAQEPYSAAEEYPIGESESGSSSPSSPRGPRTETIVLHAGWTDAVQTPPPPEALRDRLARIGEAGATGRVEVAVMLAVDLEREAALLYGATHPHVLQSRAVRAHVSTLAHDWIRAADLYLGIAEDWLHMSGDRSFQVRENAANAHACWRRITHPQESERVGEAVVRMWLKVPGAERYLHAARRRRDWLRRQLSLGLL
ncbi:hypothetical protein GCM10011579_039700 [Streptomyces albiflavescens]|uniref:Uncharacterized protein n=1 Tax=Streptomyces albiflavescens TaxID=1623582 RepID=A0A918D5F2_9ACTN|nr:hypothetical protein [Streptomyces albiflavescens]GGN67308.1 hypothetical protein GCM10011579_039700 [Streptomyces albiflavescens]